MRTPLRIFSEDAELETGRKKRDEGLRGREMEGLGVGGTEGRKGREKKPDINSL